MDDRPGALGSVASRIGAVKGDLVAIEILERGAGRVIDELTVDLPGDDLEELLIREVQEVDGVDVENLTLDPNPRRDSRVDPLLSLASALEEDDPSQILKNLILSLSKDYMTLWSVVYDSEAKLVIAKDGTAPLDGWIKACVEGLTGLSSEVTGIEPPDLAVSVMPRSMLVLLFGRINRPFRDLEREQIHAIARIADAGFYYSRTNSSFAR